MPHGLAITPDGSHVLVSGFGTDRVLAIDTASNQIVWQTPVAQPHNIAITADGRTAYVASQGAGATAIVILDVASGARTGAVPEPSAPRALSLTPDGEDLLFTLAGVDAVQVLDVATDEVESQIPVGASPHYPLSTANGALSMVVSQGPGTLDLFDPETYTRTGVIQVGQMPHWIALAADGRTAYVTNESSDSVSVVDLGTETVTATIPVGHGPRKIVLQPATTAAGSAPIASTSAAPTSESTVSIAQFAFAPATLTVRVGQTITFTNRDSVAHTTTSPGGGWDSGPLAPGASYTVTPQQPGTYGYHCSIHPFMTGTVVVTS
jgi:YVTN family beta-propeller protein